MRFGVSKIHIYEDLISTSLKKDEIDNQIITSLSDMDHFEIDKYIYQIESIQSIKTIGSHIIIIFKLWKAPLEKKARKIDEEFPHEFDLRGITDIFARCFLFKESRFLFIEDKHGNLTLNQARTAIEFKLREKIKQIKLNINFIIDTDTLSDIIKKKGYLNTIRIKFYRPNPSISDEPEIIRKMLSGNTQEVNVVLQALKERGLLYEDNIFLQEIMPYISKGFGEFSIKKKKGAKYINLTKQKRTIKIIPIERDLDEKEEDIIEIILNELTKVEVDES